MTNGALSLADSTGLHKTVNPTQYSVDYTAKARPSDDDWKMIQDFDGNDAVFEGNSNAEDIHTNVFLRLVMVDFRLYSEKSLRILKNFVNHAIQHQRRAFC